MILKRIKLNNIRSYEEGEIIFPVGSTLLSGDIGSGKTSILLGIEFGIFGLQPGQKGASLLRNEEKEGRVELECEIEGKTIIIERTIKRAKSISQDYCAITVEGEKKEMAVTELKNYVLELLNYPKEFSKKQNLLYKFTVYTPQEEMKQIILQDAQTRINTIRHIFGIDKYKRILENMSLVLSKFREQRRFKEGVTKNLEQDKIYLEEKEQELESKYYQLSSIQKELFLKSEERKKVEVATQDIQDKIEEKRKCEQEVEKMKLMLTTKADALLENNKLINTLKEQIAEVESVPFEEYKIFQLEKEIQSFKNDLEKITENAIEITSKINMLQSKNEDGVRMKEKMSHLEICPTCLQDVDPVYKSNVLNKVEEETRENDKALEQLKIQKVELAKKKENLLAITAKKEKELSDLRVLRIKMQGVEEKKKRIHDIERMNDSIKKDREMFQNNLVVLQGSIQELAKYEQLFARQQEEIEEVRKQEHVIEIKGVQLQREIEVFNKNVEEHKKHIQETQKVRDELKKLMEIEHWLQDKFAPLISNVERNVMVKLKTEFSDLFHKWFCMLVSDTFTARIDEEFTPIIEQHDYEIPYEYLSGGERTAVALAYRLALNQVINSLLSEIKTKDLVILDEPTDGFSETQLDKIRDVLMQLNVKQLLLVSHEQKIESFVENILRFKKENGITRLDQVHTE